ncbi:MAG: hypothetical protein IJX39_04915 [Clostridia bacterium]|nr:hypothetical protein [Clostridia bacterium]
MKIPGKILSVDNDTLLIRVQADAQSWCLDHGAREAEVRIDDGRTITALQRRKIYATIRDIAEWMGDTPEAVKIYFKWSFCGDEEHEDFSLSNVDKETASAFLSYLIDFCIQNGVPCSDPLWDRCEDIERYMYACVMTRTCCITGKKNAQIHHYDRIGMGRNRDTICQVGMRVVPLSADIHTMIHYSGGEDELYEKHHITPIALTEKMCRHLNLGKIPIT